jgi:pimeloyl-ACP methyl ester carboxylesterase
LSTSDGTAQLLLGTAGEKASLGRDQLRSIDTSMLVVNGAETQRYFGEVGRAVADGLPNARHTVVSGASHAVPSHNALEFNSALLGFVAGVLGTAPAAG